MKITIQKEWRYDNANDWGFDLLPSMYVAKYTGGVLCVLSLLFGWCKIYIDWGKGS